MDVGTLRRRLRPPLPGGARGVAIRLVIALVLLLATALAAGWIVTRAEDARGFQRADSAFVRWLAGNRDETLDDLSGPVAELGNTGVVIGIAIAVAVVLVLFRRPRWVLVPAVALLGEVAIFLTTAAVIDRRRPPVPHLDAELPPTSSFPSGHTAAAVCLYGAIAVLVLAAVRAWWRWLVVALAVVVVVAVALARLYRGAHFPTDVLGSLLFAVPWLVMVRRQLLGEPSPAGPDGGR
jgi:undecaprenyl-diphosphatase